MKSNANAFRAGRYIQQPTGQRAFLPAPLPPNRLDGSIQTLPNPDLFVFMDVRKEAVLSSQIERTQSSLQDRLLAEAQIFSPTRPEDDSEVVNSVDAMNYGPKRLTGATDFRSPDSGNPRAATRGKRTSS